MGRERRDSRVSRKVVAVGLTGGIGAGKSTALGLFAEYGDAVLSADQIVHDLYEQAEVKAQVAGHFGGGVLDAEGDVDRASLAEAVRGRVEELRWLEQLTHPLVEEEIASRVEHAPEGSVLVVEVPLLFESGYECLFDLVVTVEAGDEVRRGRSTHSFGLEQFSEFETLQASRERRVSGSDMAYVNDGGLDGLRSFVEGVHERALMLLRGDDGGSEG